MERRTFLRGLAGLIAAPAIIRTPGLIMPVKAIVIPQPRPLPDDFYITLQSGKYLARLYI